MNSLFQQMNQMNDIQSLMRMYRSNPQECIRQMAKNNPNYEKVMKDITGRNPKEVFFEQAKAKGVDPEEFIKKLNCNLKY